MRRGGGLVIGDLDLTPGPQSLFWLAMLGFFSQFLGYLLISLSLPRLPAVVTSIILLAQPVATVALAMILLGETPSTAPRGRGAGDRRDRCSDGAGRPGPTSLFVEQGAGRRASGPSLDPFGVAAGRRCVRRERRPLERRVVGLVRDLGAPLVDVTGRRVDRADVRRQVRPRRVAVVGHARSPRARCRSATPAATMSSTTDGGIRSGATARSVSKALNGSTGQPGSSS